MVGDGREQVRSEEIVTAHPLDQHLLVSPAELTAETIDIGYMASNTSKTDILQRLHHVLSETAIIVNSIHCSL